MVAKIRMDIFIVTPLTHSSFSILADTGCTCYIRVKQFEFEGVTAVKNKGKGGRMNRRTKSGKRRSRKTKTKEEL